MTIEQLIKQLQQFNPKAKVSINCPDTSDTRSIWYVDTDFGDEDNHVDIVMQKFDDDNPNSVGYYGYNQKTDNYYPNLDD